MFTYICAYICKRDKIEVGIWQVRIKKRVAKLLKDEKGIPKEVISAVIALISELEMGPAVKWPNYSKLRNVGRNKDFRHCHLQKGKPTWVASWEVDKKNNLIEVYYVGTHEKAPY